jgi:hypothetical protein
MMRPENELEMQRPLDDMRVHLDEQVVLIDAVANWRNRHGIDPMDMPTPEGRAVMACIGWDRSTALHPMELVERAAALCIDELGAEDARKAVQGIVDYAYSRHEIDRTTDTLASAAAARLKRVAAVRRTQAAERKALQAAMSDPTTDTRRAYRNAMAATDEAYSLTPARRRSLDELLDESVERMRGGQGRACVGIATPTYPMLSNAMFGWRGLIVLAAAPGIGKTTLSLAAAIDAVESNADACALFVSFEMPTRTLADRLLAEMSGVDQRHLRTGIRGIPQGKHGWCLPDEAVERVGEADGRLRRLNGRVAVVGREDIGSLDGAAPLCFAKVARMVEDLKSASGASRSFVVVDHLGVVPVSPPGGGTWPNDTERAKHVMSGLVGLRDRLGEDDPVVVIAQARKSDWGDAGLASVMGTADIAYSADAVITMERVKDEPGHEAPDPSGPQRMMARVVKGRDMMRYTKVGLSFDPKTSTISEDAGAFE